MTGKSKQGVKSVGGSTARTEAAKARRFYVKIGDPVGVENVPVVSATSLKDAYSALFDPIPAWVVETCERPGAKKRREAFNQVIEAVARQVVVHEVEKRKRGLIHLTELSSLRGHD